jgi:S-adenosylmethionine:tRNA ribosyltransferase-isomerase
MRLSDFDFELPEALIALRPAEPRDMARLLVASPGVPLQDRTFRDLPGLLRPGDALVFNDTRVIPARLFGRRERAGIAASVEATLLKRLAPEAWSALMRPGKRLRAGDRILFGQRTTDSASRAPLTAVVEAKGEAGEVTLIFDRSGADLDLAIETHGVMPLPPYIAGRRDEDDQDRRDYQTIYAKVAGSVAAPTAGLHFTEPLLAALSETGISCHYLTLHVGAGTFLPVKTESVANHRMHAEFGEVTDTVADALNRVRAMGGRIVCVGTTTLRLLESAAGADGRIRPFLGETDIFITPGHRFLAADGLITNFHLPKSTLFMLVCALAGTEAMRAAYRHAIANGYRFYSYGDASLVWGAAE